jgi:hypothetical protein
MCGVTRVLFEVGLENNQVSASLENIHNYGGRDHAKRHRVCPSFETVLKVQNSQMITGDEPGQVGRNPDMRPVKPEVQPKLSKREHL